MFHWPLITDLARDADELRRWRAGCIEVRGGLFVHVRRLAWSHRPSRWEALTVGRWLHTYRPGDCCRLYYHQPRSCPDFIALDYIQSSRDTSIASCRQALAVLDQVAMLKRSWGIVCDVSNLRISTRLLRRWGWEAHAPMSFRRNYIKRFVWPELPQPMLARPHVESATIEQLLAAQAAQASDLAPVGADC